MRNKLLVAAVFLATVISPTVSIAEPGTIVKSSVPSDQIVNNIQATINSEIETKDEIAARQIEANLIKIAEQKKAEEVAAEAKKAAAEKAAHDQEIAMAQAKAKTKTVVYKAVAQTTDNSDAIAYGRKRNAEVFGESHWSALFQLWSNESGWRDTAMNYGSGACGIPQFINGCVLGDHVSQIDRGLAYIASRYGNPTNALSFWNTHHWY